MKKTGDTDYYISIRPLNTYMDNWAESKANCARLEKYIDESILEVFFIYDRAKQSVIGNIFSLLR